jgi:hypothetical protein
MKVSMVFFWFKVESENTIEHAIQEKTISAS